MREPAAIEIEAPPRPAPDEVSEGLHPARTPFLLGHAEAENLLADALAGDGLHHAWLLSGPPGIGKATLAYRFARKLLAGSNEDPGLFGNAPTGLDTPIDGELFAQVATGSHPNLLRLARRWDYKTKKYPTRILIDEVRRLYGFLGQRATQPGRRVVIVDSADELQTPNAANSLLKPLEEPPLDTVFVLISHQPGRLLPTIRSRCRQLTLRAPEPADSLEILARLTPDLSGAEAATLLALSGQSPGMAIRLSIDDGLATYDTLLDLFEHLPNAPRSLVQKLTTGMDRAAGGERRFDLVFELTEGIVRRMIAAGVPGGPAIPEALARERDLTARLGGGGLDQWFDLCDNLRRLRERTNAVHLNRKAVSQTLVSAMESAARRAGG